MDNKIQKTARGLLGWMDQEQAILFQASMETNHTNNSMFTQRAKEARVHAANLCCRTYQTDVVSPSPDDIYGHIDALKQSPSAKDFFADGWEVAMVDLRRVCAIQPTIFTEQAKDRVLGIEATDINGLAKITLPLPTSSVLPAQFDSIKQAWIISTQNPNLRIVGNWGAPVQPGIMGFGFAVTVMQSFVQVARYGDRYLLRDGYHRAYGCLQNGIYKIPAFVKDFSAMHDLALPPGMLPANAYLGKNPPLLLDYLNDEVSIEAQIPSSQKMIVIHGLEIAPLA